MKKRWAMGLLCCLLLFQLAFPAKAAGSVYFVAAEESVLPVTDATMPFWANGYLYVPASVFTNLGISVINNTAKKMTVLEKDRRAMLFDWAKGTAGQQRQSVHPRRHSVRRTGVCPGVYRRKLFRPAIFRDRCDQRLSGVAAVSGFRHERQGFCQCGDLQYGRAL